ncbi:MAG: nucleoside-diphosphate sugar epimerase/dehydratase [Lachnospiraceae bacterium]|jgi:FlaA1/EpsC-like NDP-sugar epimerase|nr:polysaccharide biosynthesis protein [Lachnospiraceae bacterium]MCI6665805.1 polysaccharide biosynthesis protein [Lachnospiraceae bacterium]MCI6978534.1 polysaccharide biosynthesis protein [Lachnospiraceae bacterium]MDD6580535.1 nucleoside-diphosphate sugar epimerase/dehydratase [Lachnospiraceae bacterium]MDD7222757.1 nucleoside-diphosphate sugar epimerase/dehydratase [Lachnospiraceae bacterium]
MNKFLAENKQLIIRRFGLVVIDILSVALATYLGLIARFDFDPSFVQGSVYGQTAWNYLPYSIVITILLFWVFHLYQSLWQYAGTPEIINIFLSCVFSAISQMIIVHMFLKWPYPRSCYVFFGGFLLACVVASRFFYRAFRTFVEKRTDMAKAVNVMVIGAGESANLLIREMKSSSYIQKNALCVIDDFNTRVGSYIHGVKVVGGRDDILENVARYDIDEIIIAMPSAPKSQIREILDICKQTKCELKTLPGMYQLVNGDVNVSQLRKVDVIDLLGREQIQVDLDSIMGYVMNKVILVTGGGGSIGSELCRQIAEKNPKQLIIFDIYENSAYDIQQELIKKYPDLDLKVLIGSVRNTNRVNQIFEKYHPDIVYHAAAHKHVPLMEESPNEAIKNNVLGTWKVADAADKYGTGKFVMISTDKAVNPTNIMGATKRICEMIVQAYNSKSKTEFVAVRFGNVLGSNGSVIPLFKKQIAAGGPVTVTHPDIIRYFMTIPEAVSLVLQAGAYAKGGEIFVLDMGEPVKILDLAKNLIRLSGYIPGEDIKIEFTGLRPGEKLYEEMLMAEEGLKQTKNKLIHIGEPIEFDEEEFFKELEELAVESKDELSNEEIKEWVKKLVPTYRPSIN